VKGKKKSRSKKPENERKIHIPRLSIEVTADFYSLKHSNLDEVTALLDMEAAAKLAAHKSTAMVKNHYAVGESDRQMDRLRQASNVFA
jgi:hypothetical protein